MAFDEKYISRLVDEFRKVKDTISSLEERMSGMRTTLLKTLIDDGMTDDKGHQWLKAEGKEIKRERRVSTSFDFASAEKWAKENGHWDSVKKVVEVLDEDKLLALAWDNPEVQEVMKTFYVERESWALKV